MITTFNACKGLFIRSRLLKSRNLYSSTKLFSEINSEVTETETLLKTELSCLEIRVGKIMDVSKHPDAEKCFVEKIDVGDKDGPRIIVSGLADYCTADEILNRNVVVLCNLKPRAIKGVISNGMILCASLGSDENAKVLPLDAPKGVKIGELVTFKGYSQEIIEPGNKPSKAYSKIADNFVVDENGVATYNGVPFMTSSGPITSTLLNGKIS